MSRPRLAIGTFGDIGVVRTPGGRHTARARYRDWDGKTRLVEATADTSKAATQALKQKLTSRALFQPSSTALSPDSLFGELVAYWLEDLDLEDRLSRTTRLLYERNMRTLVLPRVRESHWALKTRRTLCPGRQITRADRMARESGAARYIRVCFVGDPSRLNYCPVGGQREVAPDVT